MAEGRSVWRLLLNNIRTSLKLLPPKGRLIGKDQLGNEYYEAPLNVHSHRKSKSRWFKPQIEDDWQQNLPPEWEAWLRGRRKDPPTEEEIMANISVAEMKKVKGAEIEAKYKKEQDPGVEKNITGFPKLKDYEIEAGLGSDNKKI